MAAEAGHGWESVLDSVVVYATGALCRRRARGTVPPDGRVRLTGLPRALDGGSLRASVIDGDGRVTEARLEQVAELREAEELPELQRLAEQAHDRLEAAEERHALQLRRLDEVAALRAVPPPRRREEPHRRTPTDAWLDLADFVDERLTALHARAEQLRDELHRAEHDAAVAQERLERASSAAPAGPVETSATAVLTLSGEGEQEVEIELEYGVPGAVWVPSYRLSHGRGDGSGTLLLRASVAQRTGEDWTGVRLGLSTADLRRRTDLPQLRSIRIGRRQPAPAPSGWREPPGGLDELFAGFDAAGPRPEPPRAWTLAAVAAGAAGKVGAVGAAPEGSGAFGGAAPGPVAYGMAPPAPGGPMPAPMAAPMAGPIAASAPMPAMAPRMRMGPQAAPPPGRPSEPGRPAAPAEPAVGPPHPDPQWLDYAALALSGPDQGDARRGRLGPGGMADLVTAEYRHRAEAVASLPLPRHAVRPRVSAGSFDHRYDAAARVDLPSDGTWHTVTVGEIPVGLLNEYVCVPSVEETVYSTLVLSNATDRALLAGPVEVTVDGEFLLTAALPTLAPGGTRRVGLGVAEGIRVARRTEVRESTAGMLNNTTVLDHRVHVELANRLAHPVTVEVRERVPVSQDTDIRIEERPGWTAPDRTAPDESSESCPPSTRRWRVDLPAHGTAELDGGYEIRIPAGKALLGGNRRN